MRHTDKEIALAEKEYKCVCGFHPGLNPDKFKIIFCEFSPTFHANGVYDHWSARCLTCDEEFKNSLLGD